MKIVIADDDKIIRKGLKLIIANKIPGNSIIVREVSNGDEALELVKAGDCDLLITDMKMPVMDGITLIKEIATLGINIKIIVLSGFDEYKYVRESLKNGAIDYLLKPINKNDFGKLLFKIKNEWEDEIQKKLLSEQLTKKLQKNIESLKECFFVDLIKDTALQKEYIDSKLIEYDMEKNMKYVIGVLGIDYPRRGAICVEAKEKAFLFDMIKKRIKEAYTLRNIPGPIVTAYKKEIIILFMIEKEEGLGAQSNVRKAIEEMGITAPIEGEYTVSIGISQEILNIAKAHEAYSQAKDAYEKKFFLGKGCIVSYDMNKKKILPIEIHHLNGKIDKLSSSIITGDLVETKIKMIEIMTEIKENVNNSDEFRQRLREVIFRLYEKSKEFKEIEHTYLIQDNQLFESIELIEVYGDLEKHIMDILENILKKINQTRNSKNAKVIERAKTYIGENYDKDISLKAVAEYVYLNPSYFSLLFKNETGRNFVDYLVEIRVEAAKKFLQKPDVKVYEVAKLVGYNEITSFNRAFKRIVGVSPSDYKKWVK